MNRNPISFRARAAGLLLAAALGGCTLYVPVPTGETLTPTAPPVAAAPATAAPTTAPTPTAEPTATQRPSPTATDAPTATARPTATRTPSGPTATSAPTEVIPTASPTPVVFTVTINEQANCRYGPGKAYLYSYGLYEGDKAVVDGRNSNTTWLWIKPEKLDRHCWAATSVMTIPGDPNTLPVVQTKLPSSTLYGPPANVWATRSGNQVTITWSPVDMTADDDRGYLLELLVCQNGGRVFFPVSVVGDTRFTVTDDTGGCFGTSGGRIYTVEKHGYTSAVTIPWP